MNRVARGLASVATAGLAAAPTAVLTSSALPAAAHKANPNHLHNAWTKYTIFEQFGVTATETFLGWEYYENYTDVWGQALHGDSYCYHSSFPGWTTRSCTDSVYKFGGNGSPETLNANIWGDFDSSVGPSYTQYSYGDVSNTDGRYVYGCYLTRGSLPYLWSGKCQGGYWMP